LFDNFHKRFIVCFHHISKARSRDLAFKNTIMKNPYENKVAVVTGGASGIGKALCRGLAGRGARVIVADIDYEGARAASSEIASIGGHTAAVRLDVADATAVFEAVANIADEYQGLDYFFNNAGISITGDVRDITMEQWNRVLGVNLHGVIHGTVAAYGIMARQGHGHIVNIASMAGFAPFSINTPYSTAKYGVVGFTEALRPEAEDLGVDISLVCPGIVRTSLYDTMEVVRADREKYNHHLPRNLLGPDEAAEIILRRVARNKRLILFPFHARLFRWLQVFAPRLMGLLNRKMVREFRLMRK
jgi:NAD(P)-dependent dehydrogenase (short-subunit alcohol dehydrogenase family)